VLEQGGENNFIMLVGMQPSSNGITPTSRDTVAAFDHAFRNAILVPNEEERGRG